MLIKLSLRNAKRQSKDYSLYFVTLACTVSFMYAFNSLIFSKSVKLLPSAGVLPYMILAASMLIILIMSQIIGYMTKYILKKRSRELSIYMMSGISNKTISILIFYENALVGSLAFILGLPFGILLTQLLEAILLHMFGMTYVLNFGFSLYATGLTFIYFLVMLLFSIQKNRKWVRKVNLYDLLYYDRQNEKSGLSDSKSAMAVFFLSFLLGCLGIILMCAQPLGSGYDALAGVIFLILFLAGFFLSTPVFLVVRYGNREAFKYEKNRLITFRGFTAKIHSTSIVMGMLSVLFMLSLTCMGVGTAIYMIADKNVEQSMFDIMILHKDGLPDFTPYENVLHNNFSIRSNYSYSIYTDAKKDFLNVRNDTISKTGRSGYTSFVEFQNDTYIKQSDYKRLRTMLGYESVTLNPSLCYVHCVPALEKNFSALMKQDKNLNHMGYPYAEKGVFCEPFNQMDTYGNGLDYVIIVPDKGISQTKVLYSLLVAVTESPLDGHDLQSVMDDCKGLTQLKRNIGKSVPNGKYMTSLIDDVDYLSGKWVDKENLTHLYAMAICLFYLAFILEITGAAVLATQILSDREKKQKQDCILRQLGMTEKLITQLNNRQLSLLFLLPILPSLIISSCFVSVSAFKIQLSAFHLPTFTNNLWILQSLSISLVIFLLLYGIYYIAAQISNGPNC